jgi:hypothetical protein
MLVASYAIYTIDHVQKTIDHAKGHWPRAKDHWPYAKDSTSLQERKHPRYDMQKTLLHCGRIYIRDTICKDSTSLRQLQYPMYYFCSINSAHSLNWRNSRHGRELHSRDKSQKFSIKAGHQVISIDYHHFQPIFPQLLFHSALKPEP